MNKLTSRKVGFIAAAGFAVAMTGVANADALSDTIEGFTADGKVSLNARARYEYIDGPGSNDVNGYSIRTRLGYTTGEVQGFKAMIEMEDVSFADPDDRPGLDVPTTELNQVWLSYKNDTASGKLGRQIYTLDDHRFIGHVGWRQNIQTFDALSSVFNVADVKVNLTYLDAVHRINATAEDLQGIVLNGAYEYNEAFKVSGFLYSLDFDNKAAWSSDTLGFRATGKFDSNEVVYNYAVSYARQTDNSGSASGTDFNVDYLAAEFSGKVSGFTAAIGYESLGSDGGRGFSTPLATVHKFNGFADVFAGNSIGGSLKKGLDDLYLKLGFKAGPVPITLFYHDFGTDEGSVDLGSEIDAVAKYKVNDYVTLVAKYAYYESDREGTVDTPGLDGEIIPGNNVTYGQFDKSVFTLEANLKF